MAWHPNEPTSHGLAGTWQGPWEHPDLQMRETEAHRGRVLSRVPQLVHMGKRFKPRKPGRTSRWESPFRGWPEGALGGTQWAALRGRDSQCRTFCRGGQGGPTTSHFPLNVWTHFLHSRNVLLDPAKHHNSPSTSSGPQSSACSWLVVGNHKNQQRQGGRYWRGRTGSWRSTLAQESPSSSPSPALPPLCAPYI